MTPLIAVLFTFQSPYLFTIGRPGVLSLGGWAPRLHTEFHGIRATLGILSTESNDRRVRGCHPVSPAFPDRSADRAFVTPRGPATPGTSPGLGYIRVRSPLLTESRLISFPPGTEMYQFPGSALTRYEFTRQSHPLFRDVGLPHSDISGSTLVCQLPGAYRRLPRLSSPLDA